MTNTQKTYLSNIVAGMASMWSQERVAVMLDVSKATVNHIVNKNWDLISDGLWRSLRAELQIKDLNWRHAPTSNGLRLENVLDEARQEGTADIIAVAFESGAGKSHTYARYAQQNKDVVYVKCGDRWNKKALITALFKKMGLRPETKGVINQSIELFSRANALQNPLFIVDQANALNNDALIFLLDLYEEVPHVSIVISGTEDLETKILKGVARKTNRFRELYTRIGRKFINELYLKPITLQDVANISIANGLKDELKIKEIFHKSLGIIRVAVSCINAELKKMKKEQKKLIRL